FGKRSCWARKTTCFRATRRPASKPANASIRRRRQSLVNDATSNRNTKRHGALRYLAFWDVHRGVVLGRCEAKREIIPFGRLMDQVLVSPPYDRADRLFFIVDKGSSHRGKASIQRMKNRDTRIVLVHTPKHASWLNQVEIYFSIIQRKVLT